MNDERRSNCDAFQGKCYCCSYKTRSGIVLSSDGCSERLSKSSHWQQNMHPVCYSAHWDFSNYAVCPESNAPYYTLDQSQANTKPSEKPFLPSWSRRRDFPVPDCNSRWNLGPSLWNSAPSTASVRRDGKKNPRRINGSQMRFKSGRLRVIRVEHWPYTCLLDNSCLFVRVLTPSQPHYVATVAYRKIQPEFCILDCRNDNWNQDFLNTKEYDAG